MSRPGNILFRSFVKPFYKENAGLFLFVFTMMFFIVNKVDGAELFQYHYSLISATLKSPVVLLLVLLLWLLYARKCFGFVSHQLKRPEQGYLYILNILDNRHRFRLFFVLEVWLLLPVLLYAALIVIVGLRRHLYLSVGVMLGFLLLISVSSAAWYVRLLSAPGELRSRPAKSSAFRTSSLGSYTFILLALIVHTQKLIWAGIKVFTCGLLYLLARNNTLADYDIKVVYLFFSFGILANGVLIHRLRELQDVYLSFYRGLPVPLTARFLQYAAAYAVSLLPEFITLFLLTPVRLHYGDALGFFLSGYSLALLMNSLCFFRHVDKKEFLKISGLLFFVQYGFLLATGWTAMYVTFFISAVALFRIGYFRYERAD